MRGCAIVKSITMKEVSILSVFYLLVAALAAAGEHRWGMEHGEWLSMRMMAAVAVALAWRAGLDIWQRFTLKENTPKPNVDFLFWSFIIYIIFAGSACYPQQPKHVYGTLVVGCLVVPPVVALLSGFSVLIFCALQQRLCPKEED